VPTLRAIVEEPLQHRTSVVAAGRRDTYTFDVLQDWARRDLWIATKVVKSFRPTFNSSFWNSTCLRC